MLLRSLTEKASQRPFTSRLVPILAVGVISVLAVLAASLPNAQPASAQGGGPEMKLDVTRGGTCDGSTCTVAIDGVFALSVEIVEAPTQAYFGAQSFIDFGSELIYNMTEDQADEIIWPDCTSEVSVRFQFTPQTANHGCLTGLIQPLPVSTYTGRLVELSFTCSASPSSTLVKLLPLGDDTVLGVDADDNPITADTSGAGFALEDNSQVGANVSDLTIDCIAGITAVPTVTPGGPTRTPPATAIKPSDTTPRSTEEGGSQNGGPGDGSDDRSDDDSGDGQGQTILIVAIIIVIIVIGGGGAVFFVRRQRGATPSDQE